MESPAFFSTPGSVDVLDPTGTALRIDPSKVCSDMTGYSWRDGWTHHMMRKMGKYSKSTKPFNIVYSLVIQCFCWFLQLIYCKWIWLSDYYWVYNFHWRWLLCQVWEVGLSTFFQTPARPAPFAAVNIPVSGPVFLWQCGNQLLHNPVRKQSDITPTRLFQFHNLVCK